MKISNTISKSIFIVSTVSIILVLLITILLQYNNFLHESQEIKATYIEQKKKHLKKEVEKVYKYIEFRDKEIIDNLKKELKQKVENAYNTALYIYNENKNKKSEEEIKELIVNILKNYNFTNERAYYFINSNKGRAILFNKEIYLNTYKDIWNLYDEKGEYIIQKQSTIALTHGSGYITNHFVKPDLTNNKQYPKLSYIKYFEPYNWHIGIGEYLDEIEKQVQDTILNYIASIRYDKSGYIYLNTLDKKALIFNGEKQSPAINYPSYELFKQQLDASNNNEGGFIRYNFTKLDSKKEYPKIAYVKRYEKWGWIIGTGAYIDEIDEIIEQKKLFLKNSVFFQLELAFIFILLIILIIYFISKKTSSLINMHIESFIDEFKIANKEFKKINTYNLAYDEFKTLANSLNQTLEQRNKDYEKLNNYTKIINEHIISSSTDLNGIITDVSQAFCEISGFTKEELIGENHNIIRDPNLSKEFYEEVWEQLNTNNSFKGEIKNRKKSGESYWVDIIIQPIFENGVKIGYTAIKHDITDKKRIEELSITDELTKLFNRRHFNIKIEDLIKKTHKKRKILSLFIMDVDYFKKYNDTYGHQEGDEALIKISSFLKSFFEKYEAYVFRLGGEEFAVLLISTSKEESILLAENLREGIEKLKIIHEKSETSSYMTSSIGIAFLEENMGSKELYINADKALYKAKQEGRNRVSIF